MQRALRSLRTAARWLVPGGLLLAACTDSNEPASGSELTLAFVTQPANTTAGVAISPVVTVAILDESGNTVTTESKLVSVRIETNPAAGSLAGTTTVATVDGVATFSNLRIAKAGTGYTLGAHTASIGPAISSAFDITPGPAEALVFTSQPASTMGGTPLTPVEVEARDSVGNRALDFQDLVTITLVSASTPSTLSGTTAVNAVNGIATFSDLVIDQVSAGYTLTASAEGLSGGTSATFTITPPMATLRITAVTAGVPQDPDGYAGCVDPASAGHGETACGYGGPLAVGVNGSGMVTVDTGAHAVLLTGVATTCAVTGDNPRQVRVAIGDTVTVPYSVTCAPMSLHVTTTTTGVPADPDGYSVCVDTGFYYSCYYAAAIAVNGEATIPVGPGAHEVLLDGVAPNCTVSGANPRTVMVSGRTDVPFAITCAGAGSVRLHSVSTGTDIPEGLSICIDRSLEVCFWSTRVPANGEGMLSAVLAGPRTMTLTGLTENCTVSGGATREVTVPSGGVVDVTFNIACVLAERIGFVSGGMLALIRADGSGLQTIRAGIGPAWSSDGARLAYECAPEICVVNADGTGFAQLTVNPAGNYHPTWSPDGTKVAFALTRAGVVDLYVMAANGSGVVRLTQGVGFLGSPAWSPDGSKIAFDCRVDAGNDDICLVNADGTGFARLTSDPARDDGAAWKRDGSTLAFATTRFGADQIVLMSPSGGGVTRIGAGLAGFAPTWSPDGTRLALVRVGAQSFSHVLVANSDGSNVRDLGAGSHPAWKPHP